MTRKQKLSLAVAAALNAGGFISMASATDIYTETWSGGSINPTNYTLVSTTANGTASVVNGILTSTTGTTGAATGNIRVYTPTTGAGTLYDGSFNPQLDNNGNGNLLTWNLNMQESRSAPSGFANTNSGVAYILGATSSDFFNTGEGYAVTIGSTGTDPVCLIHYTAGLASVGLSAKSAPFNIAQGSLAEDTKYMSVRVTYAPGSDTWKLYLRDDGSTAFADAINSPVPDTGLVGSAVLAASTSSMLFSGFGQTHTSTNNNLGQWDNIKLAIDVLPPSTPRNLIWDSDATGAATDGSGTWSTANTFINQADSSHVTFEDGRPDNATFGTGTGTTGAATITISSAQTVGLLTFAASSTNYTVAGGTLTIAGYDDDANPGTELQAMSVKQSSSISSTVNWPSAGVMHVDGSSTVLTLDGALSGGGIIDKFGTGTLLLNALAPARSGDMNIQTGTVRVTAMAPGGGVSGLGTGQTNIKDGGTLWLDASGIGGTGGVINSAGGALFIGDNSTLRVSGQVTWQKNFPLFANGSSPTNARNSTIHVDAGGTLLFRAQLKNQSTIAENFHTIHVDGPGIVKITNSGTDAGGDASQDIFSGSWDLSDGYIVMGKNSEATAGSTGDTLNALGKKGPDPALDVNTITIRGAGTLVGTENVSNPVNPSLDFYRARIILSGGALASGNGTDTNYSGTITVNGTGSRVLTYDPLNPATPRSVTLKKGASDSLTPQGDMIWNGNLTVDPGATTGGAFNINRTLVTSSDTANPTGVSVTPGATITVLQGAALNIGGASDALSDGTNYVNVTNQSSNGGFNITTGAKNVGAIDGTGTLSVASGGSLTATHIIQGAANFNDNAEIRPSSLAAGVSNIRSLTIASPAKLNLQDNKLVTANAAGSWNGSAYTDVTGLVATGKGATNMWDGPTGIVTTQSNAVGSNYNSIGVAKASDVLPATATATGVWAGQTITGTDTLVMYTYGGDATLDGKINIDDYVKIDTGIASQLTGWVNGDFNYDGVVNIDDYTTLIDANIGNQNGVFYTAGGAGDAGGASGVAAVPEPASLSVLAIGATALLARRRRRA